MHKNDKKDLKIISLTNHSNPTLNKLTKKSLIKPSHNKIIKLHKITFY
jgi:hypothetical protein